MIWTDVVQAVLMIGSLIPVLIKGTIDFGSFSEIWQEAYDGGRIQFWKYVPIV